MVAVDPVLDNLQILIVAGLFNSSKHGGLLVEETPQIYRLKHCQSANKPLFCGTTFWRPF
jgi:hypothetical protein